MIGGHRTHLIVSVKRQPKIWSQKNFGKKQEVLTIRSWLDIAKGWNVTMSFFVHNVSVTLQQNANANCTNILNIICKDSSSF